MKKFTLLPLLVGIILAANSHLSDTACIKCHPRIVKEYESSMHKNASIYNDPIHKAIWDLHPAKKKGNYKCAKCHTPADHNLKALPTKNATQTSEPISCQSCHQIERIEEHAAANKNIYTKKPKLFFAANEDKKGTTLHYHDKTSFLGFFKTRVGSPYHDINYSNEDFYDAKMCLGCHDHKQNGKEFMICDMQIKEKEGEKENCISCHMPKVPGSFVTLKDSHTHRFHGATALVKHADKLSKHIDLKLDKKSDGFAIMIVNHANHTLSFQPLRLSKAYIYLRRDGKETLLQEATFQKIIGHDGKPSMPWLATEVLKDTLIKAYEKRPIMIEKKLQKGDEVRVEFGYYQVNPALAKKLQLKKSDFTLLKKKLFVIR